MGLFNLFGSAPKFTRKMLRERLIAMQEDPAIKTAERMEYMRVSRRYPPAKETKCHRCNKTLSLHSYEDCTYYYNKLVELGVDCKLELWCRECCENKNFTIFSLKDKSYVLKVRFNWWEKYKISPVDKWDLKILVHFFENENEYYDETVGTCFIGENPKIVESIREILDL